MSSAKRSKDKSGKPHVRLDDEMTDSAAWTSLSDTAVWVYIELKKRFTYDHGFSRLIMPYSEVSWRMHPKTYSNAILELCDKGFIRYVERGGLPRRPNVFALSEGWRRKSIEIVDEEGREAIRARRKSQNANTLKLQSENPRLKTSK